jgi:hypothetical protein
MRVGTPRERWRALAAAACAAAPGLALGLWAVMPTDAASGLSASVPSASALYVYFRNPHHADPRTWRIGGTTLATMLPVFAVLIGAQYKGSRWSAQTWIARFALATFLPLGIVLLASRSPTGHVVLQFFPFRVGSAISLLASVALVTSLVLRSFPAPFARWLARVAALWIAVSTVQGFQQRLAILNRFPEGGWPSGEPAERALSLVEASNFVRQHTPRDATVLASPATDTVGYLTRRPVVVLFKCVPPYAGALREWHARLVDMNGGSFTQRGWGANTEVGEHFAHLSTNQYLRLGEKYRASVLLVRRRDDLDLPVLYANAHWSVLALDGQPVPRDPSDFGTGVSGVTDRSPSGHGTPCPDATGASAGQSPHAYQRCSREVWPALRGAAAGAPKSR